MADDDKNTQTTEDDLFKGLTPINELDGELQKIAKSMQGDYTRKTQALADQRKTLEDQLKNIEGERSTFADQLKTMGQLEQEVKQWRDWHESLTDTDNDNQDPLLDKIDSNDPTNSDKGDTQNAALLETIKSLDAKIEALNSGIEDTRKSVTDTRNSTTQMFKYMSEMQDIVKADADVDQEALLKHALDKGQTDLQVAYDDLYRDKIIQTKVDELLKLRLEEERTKGPSSSTVGKQVIVKPHKDVPKTFTDAAQSVLDERAAKGLT